MRWSRAIFLSLFSAFGFVACSSGGGSGFFDGGVAPVGSNTPGDADTKRDVKRDTESSEEDADTEDAPFSKDSAADVKKNEGGNMCPSVCSSNFECQASCPAAPNGGVNCCDQFSGVCYATSSGGCGGVDGGID